MFRLPRTLEQILKKKRALPAVLKKRARTDLEKEADILSDVLKKVNDCTVIMCYYIVVVMLVF